MSENEIMEKIEKMSESDLIQLDKIINDLMQTFKNKHKNEIFAELIEKYDLKLIDEINFGESIKVRFYYNKDLKIAINSLFIYDTVISFTIIYF